MLMFTSLPGPRPDVRGLLSAYRKRIAQLSAEQWDKLSKRTEKPLFLPLERTSAVGLTPSTGRMENASYGTNREEDPSMSQQHPNGTPQKPSAPF